jgi:uncharacterized protein YvpB
MGLSELVTIAGFLCVVLLAGANIFYRFWYSRDKSLFRLSRSQFGRILPKLNLAGGAVLALVLGYMLFFPVAVKATSVSDGGTWSDYSKPLEITFNKPVNHSSLTIQFSKEIKGEWKYEKAHSLDLFKTKLVFYPEESMLPEEKVTVKTSFAPLVNVGQKEFSMTFSSGTSKPKIEVSEDIFDKQNVNPVAGFDIRVADADPNSFIIELVSNPVLELIQKRENDVIKVNHAVPFTNGQAYEVKIYLTPVTYNLKSKEILQKGERVEASSVMFKVAPSPVVKDVLPKGTNVLSTEPIEVTFDQEMDRKTVEAGFVVSPTIEGSFEWNEESTQMIFKPKSGLAKETEYKIALKGNIQSKFGAQMIQDFTPIAINNESTTGQTESAQGALAVAAETAQQGNPSAEVKTKDFSFKTIGSVGVAGTTPVPSAGGVDINTNVVVTFNQTVDKASAESKFSIAPDAVGKFSWNGNTLTFNPDAALRYAQRYTVTLAPGIKSVDGIDLRTSYSFSFTTRPNKVILSVPSISQPEQYACNVTAAAMALQFKGKNVGAWDVFNLIPKDNDPSYPYGVYPSANQEWGNPNTHYVGNVYGAYGGGNRQGYGVYWGPIANAINQIKPGSAEVKVGWNTADLLREIDKGNPSIVWWQNGSANPYSVSWKAGGQTITGVNGMHSEVVVGYEGSPENPTYVYLRDPWTRWSGGYHKMSGAAFNNLWGAYFNRAAVVVR